MLNILLIGIYEELFIYKYKELWLYRRVKYLSIKFRYTLSLINPEYIRKQVILEKVGSVARKGRPDQHI